jgi:hypothetical protein
MEELDIKAKHAWFLLFILKGLKLNRRYYNHAECYHYARRVNELL